MKSKNKKRFWGLFCGYLFSILFLTSGLVLSVTSALSLATINAGGKFNFIVPVPDESVYTGILKFYDPDSTALTISVCADPSTKSNSSYPSEVEIPSKIKVNDVTYTITIVGSFSGCSNLQSITIPDSATTINSSIYSSTTGAGVTDSLGAFENCTNLQSINIPSGIQSIATGSFSGCTGITTMTVASENTKYYSAGNAIITKNDKILVAGCKNTVIPNDVIRIGDRAFRRLTNLTSITIPTSVKTLGSSAFAFSGLTSVSVPSGVTSIASNAFAFCTSLGTISVDSANTKYKGQGNAIIEKSTNKLIVGCKNTVIPSDVKEIGNNAFQGHPITSVTIPASTTIINPYAFLSCSNLTSATFEKDYGWKVNGTAIDVASSASTNATNLSTTHVSKTWVQATPTAEEYTDFAFTFYDNADGTYTASVRAKDASTISGAKTIPTVVAKTAGGVDYIVNKIEANGFQGATNLTSIEIPSTIIEIEDYGFAGSGLTSVVVPGSVKKLGEQAFGSGGFGSVAATSLQTITLNDGLETIGYAAFHTSGLTSITIPSTVTSVGAEAFYGCSELTSAIILGQISKIDSSTFSMCSKLTNVELPNSLKIISDVAFASCQRLTSITLNQGLETIEYLAFADTGLTSITIPASVTTIGKGNTSSNTWSFTGCGSLSSVIFENPIGWKADNLYIYLGVPSQNAQYFANEDYTYGATWTRGDSQIFDFTFGANNTASVKAADGATINGGIVIPTLAMDSNGSTYTVNKVEDSGFAYQSDLSVVIFPASIRVIGESAFAGTGSGDIILNDGLETISYQAFYQSSITSVSIPSSLTSLQAEAFYQCASLASVTFSSNSILTSIGENAFQETAINNFVIPNSVTDIKSGAFFACANLTNITIPENVTTIGSSAFQYSGLTSATFSKAYGWKAGDTAVDVSESASQNATWLKETYADSIWTQATPTEDDYSDFIFTFDDTAMTASVKAKDFRTISGDKVIPKYVAKSGETTAYLVTAIDECGFFIPGYTTGATNLTGITLPNSITTIGDMAFSRSGLTAINIPDSVTKIGSSAFSRITTAQTLTLGNKVETIGNSAFLGIGASSVFIPASVKSIGQQAFGGLNNCTSLTVATGNTVYRSENNCIIDISQEMIVAGLSTSIIPTSGVSSIGPYAFSQLTSLSSITIPSNITTIGLRAFQGCTSLASITLSENLTSIGERAFYNDSALTSITIPASVNSIGVNAFQNAGLTTATFELAFGWKAGDTAVDVSGSISQNATWLKDTYKGVIWTQSTPTEDEYSDFTFTFNDTAMTASVKAKDVSAISGDKVIPKYVAKSGEKTSYLVTVIDDAGFEDTVNLTGISLPDSIIAIGNDAFTRSSISSIVIPNSVTTLGAYAFYDCTNLTSVTFGSGFSTIPVWCFYNCNELTQITIPSNVKHIGNYAFMDCSKLTTATFEDSVGWKAGNTPLNLGVDSAQDVIWLIDPNNGYAAQDWTKEDITVLTEDEYSDFTFTFDDTARTASVKAKDVSTISGNKEIPQYVAKSGTTTPYMVTAINDEGFANAKNLTGLTLPGTITKIKIAAFRNSSLKTVFIPASVTSIQNNAFGGLNNCTSLMVAINNTVYRSENNCIINISQKSIVAGIGNSIIPTSEVTSIGSYAFWGLTSLSSITIPSNITSIGQYSFQNCTNLTSITIPSSVTSIGSLAFHNVGLTSATFENIYGWHTNTISFDYDNIGNSSIASKYLITKWVNTTWTCDGLQDSTALTKLIFTVTDSNNNFVSVKKSSASITGDVIIPSAVKIDGEIYTVTSTANNAFDDCSLITKMVLPETLIRINSWSFCDTTKVTSIRIPARVEYLGYNTFQNAGIVSAVFEDTVGWYYGGSAINVTSNATNAVNLKKTSLIKTWEKIKSSTAYAEFTFTNFDSSAKTCYVQASSTSVTGNLRIPSKVRYNNATYSVTTIEQEGFMNCANITGIYIPSSITVIGARAFACTSNLGKIVVASGNSAYKSINNSVIDKDTNTLVVGCKNTIIDSSVVKIGYSAFRGAGVENITIPENVKVIDEWAFYQTKLLDSVIIEGAIEIKYGAFAESTIESISLPSTLVVIEERVFMNSYEINNVGIPAGVANIGANAFTNCRGLTNITFEATNLWFANGTEFSFNNASTNVTKLTDTYKDYELVRRYDAYNHTTYGRNQLKITSYNSSTKTCTIAAKSTSITGMVVIPNKIYYSGSIFTVTAIAEDGFSGCNNVTSIIIPYTITTIGDDGLKGTGITELFVPSSVTSIGAIVDSPEIAKMVVDASNTVYYSSGNCIIERSSMKLITGCYNAKIPSSVKIIGAWAFSGKHTLTSITLPSSLTRIEVGAFGWNRLESITIPSNVIFIQAGAFAGTDTLTSIKFNTTTGWNVDGVGSVDVTDTAQNASWLKDGGAYSNKDWTRPTVDDYSQLTFTFDDTAMTASVKATDPSTIYGNFSIPGVIRKSGGTTVYTVTGIDNLGFYKASNLTGISIPNTITSIGASAFEGTALTSITIPDTVTEIRQNAFHTCTSLASVTLGTGISQLSTGLFYNCTKLTSITIPTSVTTIGNGAFAGSGLTSIAIPSSVTEIVMYAFNNCTSLTSARFSGIKSWTATPPQVEVGPNLPTQTVTPYINPSQYNLNAEYLTNTYVAYTWTR